MEKKKVEAIVIREVMYSESSKILTLLTKELGILGVISKGCRTLKSPLRGASRILSYGNFYLNYKKDGLSTLTGVDVLSSFTRISSDLSKISYASYLLELFEQVRKGNEEEEVFDLLKTFLLKMNDGLDEEALALLAEVKCLDYLGVHLETSFCCVCGSSKNIRTVSVDAGGFLCDNCYKKEKVYCDKTIKLLRMFSLVEVAQISKLEISSEVKKEISQFLESYYDKYTGLFLKSRAFLSNLKKIG